MATLGLNIKVTHIPRTLNVWADAQATEATHYSEDINKWLSYASCPTNIERAFKIQAIRNRIEVVNLDRKMLIGHGSKNPARVTQAETKT